MIADKCANLQEIVERESVLVKTIAEVYLFSKVVIYYIEH